MNIYALIPFIAVLAYIPLFIVSLLNRPWQRKQRLFFLFLVSAMIWSLSDLFFRGDFFLEEKDILAKIGLGTAAWMMAQYLCFLQSFSSASFREVAFIYIVPALYIILAASGHIPRAVHFIPGGIDVDYGVWILVVAGSFVAITTRVVYFLWRRYRVSDIMERNQINYLVLGLVMLAIFGIPTLASPSGGRYPFAHIGNAGMACVLTYAVMAHRLLDVKVIVRRALMWLSLGVIGVATYLSLFSLLHRIFDFDFSVKVVISAVSVAVVVAVLVYKLLGILSTAMEQAFSRGRYVYQRQLRKFVEKSSGLLSMEQFGSEFTSLISQSINCEKAGLFLPEVEAGGFSVQFVYPPTENNPMAKLRLRSDSPVLGWLKREKTILLKRNLFIFPEFQSMWREEKEEVQVAGVELFVPLINRDELVAILAVGEKEDGKLYNVEDIDLVEYAATKVAAIMEREYFHQQLREKDKELTLLNRLTAIITSSLSIQEIFEGFAQELRKVAEVDWATIALIDGDELYFSALSTSIGSAWQAGQRIQLEGTATEWVCREKKSLYEPDLTRNSRFWTGEYHRKQGIRSIVYLPLIVKDQGIGALILASQHPDAYRPKQLRLLEQVALQIATPVENARLYTRMEERSRIDELTGLYNRRHFEERLREEIARHSRYGDVFSLLLVDLDNFKAYNDIYGHPSGDVLLTQIGRTIRSSVRISDQAFRYGGDEFVVILPQTAIKDAQAVAERVRERIGAEMKEKKVAVTCSIGVASYPSDGVIPGELVTAADTALYYAKRTGGDRVYLSSKVLSEPIEEAGIAARRNGLSAVYALVSAVEARDPYTYGHSRKVNFYAVALAEAIGLSPDEVSRISVAALLHDIGKIGVPDKILNKKGKLSKEEWEAVKSHPRLGANIVSHIPNLVPCVSGILYHHERWDGSGYPEGLKGEEIPLEARILAIADAFAAMTAARPYRPAINPEDVVKEMKKSSGSQFDPALVDTFVEVIASSLPKKV